MPVTPQVVAYLEAAGHGAVHASSVGLALASDTQVLEVALGEGRVVVTADLDYPRLVATSKAAGPGIILFRGEPIRTRTCFASSAVFSVELTSWTSSIRSRSSSGVGSGAVLCPLAGAGK
jgi:predicted nuclease of predicted toxin-antitoxin system